MVMTTEIGKLKTVQVVLVWLDYITFVYTSNVENVFLAEKNRLTLSDGGREIW